MPSREPQNADNVTINATYVSQFDEKNGQVRNISVERALPTAQEKKSLGKK